MGICIYTYNIKIGGKKKHGINITHFLFLQDIYMIIQYIYICNIAYLHLKNNFKKKKKKIHWSHQSHVWNRALARFGEISFIFQVQKRCQFKFVGILQATSYKAESMMPHCVFFLGINQYYNMRV